MTITWVLEREMFPEGDCLREPAEAAHKVIDWKDDWWADGAPRLDDPVVFHGSLGNADRIARELDWKPGAYCRAEGFACSSWYEGAKDWLVHEAWEIHPASALVADAGAVLDRLGCTDRVFVRPDSPLKPFSGRILQRDGITLAALDHGFYYEDPDLPVVAAPIRSISAEWRYVVVNGEVVTGSAYDADGRRASRAGAEGAPRDFAEAVVRAITAPEAVFVLDVCEVDGDLRLIELNPFSGADLYVCDGKVIVDAMAALIDR